MKYSTIVLLLLLIVSEPAAAQAKKINDHHWSGVERVVAIGDLHGDYDQYIRTNLDGWKNGFYLSDIPR